MESAKAGCLWTVVLISILGTCAFFWQFRPQSEPLLTIRMSRPVPTATPNVFHQVILEQAQVENEIKLMVVKHEQRKEWAWIAAPWAIMMIGGVCFTLAFRKWLRASS